MFCKKKRCFEHKKLAKPKTYFMFCKKIAVFVPQNLQNRKYVLCFARKSRCLCRRKLAKPKTYFMFCKKVVLYNYVLVACKRLYF